MPSGHRTARGGHTGTMVDNLLVGRHLRQDSSFLGEAWRSPRTRRLEEAHRRAPGSGLSVLA